MGWVHRKSMPSAMKILGHRKMSIILAVSKQVIWARCGFVKYIIDDFSCRQILPDRSYFRSLCGAFPFFAEKQGLSCIFYQSNLKEGTKT